MRVTRDQLRVGMQVRDYDQYNRPLNGRQYFDGELVYIGQDEAVYVESGPGGLMIADISDLRVHSAVLRVAEEVEHAEIADTVYDEPVEVHDLEVGCYIHDGLHRRRGTVLRLGADGYVAYRPARGQGNNQFLATSERYVTVLRPA